MRYLLCLILHLQSLYLTSQNESEINFWEYQAQFESGLPETEDAVLETIPVLSLGKDNLFPWIQSGLLLPGQYAQLMNHIQLYGPLLSVYELQSIPEWDTASIQRILPYCREITERETTFSLPKLLRIGTHQLTLIYSRKVIPDEEYNTGKYAGNPFRLALRYRCRFANRISMGIQMESDAGEPLFKKWNAQGFDFYGGHIAYGHHHTIKQCILGDYEIRLGQGLILWNGFAIGKSISGLQAVKSAPPLKPATSFRENGFFRGAAIHITHKEWNILCFGSFNSEDASGDYDSVSQRLSIRSTNSSGLHRSHEEGSKKNQLKRAITGGSLFYERRLFKIGIQSVYSHFSIPFARKEYGYTFFSIKGKDHWSVSADYRLFIQNVIFFGETALSAGPGISTFNGCIMAVTKNTSLSLIHRYYDQRMISLYANTWGDNANGRNEHGIYISLNANPTKKINWDIYMDAAHFPFSRYRIPGSSQSVEAGAVFQMSILKNLTMRFRYRYREDITHTRNGYASHLFDAQLMAIPLFGLSLQSRIQGNIIPTIHLPTTGFAFFQDLRWAIPRIHLEMHARVSLFSTTGYENRIYAYESGLPSQFSIPAVSGSGFRYVLNLTANPVSGLRVSANWNHTLTNLSAPVNFSQAEYQFQIEWLFGKQ